MRAFGVIFYSWSLACPLGVQIKPIVTEQEYLEQQHLLFMLKSQESDEPYGITAEAAI